MNKKWHYKRPVFSSPAQPNKRKKKWALLPFMWNASKRLCMALGVFVLISIVYGLVIASQFAPVKPADLPDKIVLYLPFEGGFSEVAPPPSFTDPFAPAKPTLRELIAMVDHAATDARVKGIYARLKPGAYQLGHVQELRASIKRFRESGKFAHIYAEGYGDINGGFGGYYLASSFDEIWMQPLGVVSITGLNLRAPYLRAVLNKIGVKPNFYQRKEYKTAYENITHEEMSPKNREMMGALLDDIRGEFLRDIPAERDVSVEAFEALVDKGLLISSEAEAAKLVSHVDHPDVLVERIKEELTGDKGYDDPLFVGAGQYLADMIYKKQHPLKAKAEEKKPKVALVYAVGAIMPSNPNASSGGLGGASGASSVFVGGNVAAADQIAPAIFAAIKDEDVEAIVLRVDSPGGSPAASETILHALEKAQSKGKIVIVSMGSVAASGGYWISASADQIFAMPTTLTGSIGVVGGKFSAAGLFDKLGVKWDGLEWGQNAGLWAFTQGYSASEEERVNVMLDDVYNSFLARVSKGREMSVEDVDKIARGRVWTGKAALNVGLVDQIGGLTEALSYTAQQLGHEDKNDLRIALYPKPKTPFDQFLELIGEGPSIYEGLRLQGQIGRTLAPLMRDVSVMQNTQGFSVYEPLGLQ